MDEQMNTIVVAVTQAVTEAVMDAATEYADGAVDRMMAEVQDQILGFEEKVGAALENIVQHLSQQVIVAVQQAYGEQSAAG